MSKKNEMEIGLKFPDMYLKDDEIEEVKEKLTELGIKAFIDRRDFYAVVNASINVIIEIPLEQVVFLLSGLINPDTWYVLKNIFKYLAMRSVKKSPPQSKKSYLLPNISYRNKDEEFFAPVPYYLSDRQFDRYMDEVHYAIKRMSNKKQLDAYIVDIDEGIDNISIKTLGEYGQKSHDE